ncbi:VOC family protein [Streptomyces sp. NPDC127110]|uniref:VOC family protein n=1 Tax=Streptomyces sp. NPDC127110 TaxID=3345362 RepID=UPI003628A962
MISGVNTTAVWVLDQDSARTFFTDKLGLRVRADVAFGEHMRWVTVGAGRQPAADPPFEPPSGATGGRHGGRWER